MLILKIYKSFKINDLKPQFYARPYPLFSDNKTPTARRFTIISLCSLVLFALVSYWSVVTQSEMGILYHFSFGNMVIIAVSALFIITVSQFFLLRDLASWYYSLYLVLSICYFHYSVFTAEHKLTDLSPFVHSCVGIMLIGGYFLYVRFTIHFLNVEKEHPNFAERLHLYAFLYLVLLVINVSLPLFFREKRALLVASMITIFACIPIGIISISECFLILRGRLARIFLAGSMCYFIGSVLGYVFASGLASNPFTNPMMKNWTFFTEFGTLLEVIFFSTGLSYRMRLIDIEKKELEKTLLINQLKELETANALLKQRERISHDLHDDVGTTLNSIAVFTEIALQQVRTINPQSILVLERIGDIPTPYGNTPSVSELTERQKEILENIVKGKSYKMIAEALFISVDTVKFHVKNIYEILQIHSRYELITRFK